MKCKCGVKLFEKDIVDNDSWENLTVRTTETYRCPKCFEVKKIKCKK